MNNPSILIYTLVMAGVTYLLRAAPILIFQKKIEKSVYPKLFVLCSLCRAGGDDLPGDFNKYPLLAQCCGWAGDSINAGVARQGAADRCAGGLRRGICGGTDPFIIK